MSDSPILIQSEQEVLSKAVSDLSSLGRVSHKLAMTNAGAPLEKVLSVLLPRLLIRVGTNRALQQEYCCETENVALKDTLTKIHAKLVEMLSHIIQRIKADVNCQIPNKSILELLYNENYTPKPNVDVFTMNLTLTFLNIGVSRCCCYQEVEALLPGLLVLLASHSGTSALETAAKTSQSHQIAHLLLKVIERMVTEERFTSASSLMPPCSSSTLAGDQITAASSNQENKENNYMEQARRLCTENREVSCAVFDLLLDVLLYQPSSSLSPNMPPHGLSQAGHERLLSNPEWATSAMTMSAKRLHEYKVSMLNFIIPTRQWSLFMSGRQHDTDGIARTVALLVVATGDAHPNVVERAALALKAHLDVMRERHEDTQAISALGEPISLSCTLLSLILGDSIAERALTQMDGVFSEMESLSLRQGTLDNVMHDISQQTLLSTKRRMASNQTAAAIMSFVSKVLDENPSWLHRVGDKKTQALSTLSVLSASKLLATTTGLLTLSTLRATPYIAAAQLLNALVIRLTALDAPPVTLLGKSLCTVCNVLLAQAAMPRPSIHSNFGSAEGSIAMRDACYGVICTLCRSRHAENYIFTCGRDNEDTDNRNNGITSMDTAKLLFACAANEEETLRPRAVAALDALLGAYCRVYVTSTSAVLKRSNIKDVMSTVEIDEPEPSNPWSQIAAPMVSDAKMQVVATANTSDLARTSDNQGLARALLPLLWSAAQSSQPKASRVAAARWSSDLLKSLDLPNACHILCFLAGDKDVTAASIARDGLGLDKTIGEAYDEHQVDSSASLPDFSDFTVALFSESSKSTSTSWRPRYYDFSHHAKAAALRFGLTCLLSDLYGGEDEAVASYVGALCETLTYFGTASSGRGSAHGRESIDLLDECSICLAGCLSTSRFARSMILSGRTTFGLEDMEALALLADSSKARRYLAEACGCIFEDCDLWQDQGAQISMTDWVNKSHILRALKICGKKLYDMQTDLFQVSEVHGAAFLGARCCRAFRVLYSKKESDATTSLDECWNLIDSIIDSLGRGTLNSDETVGNAFSLALSIALSFDGNDAPLLDTRIYAGTTSVLTSLDTALRKYGNGDHTDEARASSLANAAGIVLAASTSAAGFVADNSTPNRNVGPARIQCVDALFSLIGSNAFRKDPEIALVAGEALSDYADAYGSDSVVWESAFTDWPDTYSEDYANNLPPHQQVLYILLRHEVMDSSPHKRTAVAPALLALVGRAASLANSDSKFTRRALVAEVIRHLVEIQTAFIRLLADPKSKQLSRESCCIGLAACQGIAQAVARAETELKLSDELNDSLLRAFGQTTNFGGSAMMETRAQNTQRRQRNDQGSGVDGANSITEPFGIETVTEVGGAAGLGEAALGAYREMAAAALALGRSDVLYALFLLSISHPVWFSPGPRDRYSASALLGEFSLIGSRTNSAEMREALRPHLSKLIPRMLRACHDPNKQTREQMNTLWLGVTGGGAESRSAITENLLPTIDILMEDASSKLWRARVGACGALAEVIVGRSWKALGGGGPILDDDDIFIKTSTFNTIAAVRLLRLWRVAMRALDDVRLSVRESGETLARSVRSLSIRLCDPSASLSTPANGNKPTLAEKQEAEAYSRSAASTCLRWLVKHGLNQPCAEGVGVCVSCLLGIVEVVQPVTLEPVLSELIGALLMAMSGLEPAALNYLQVRSAGRDTGGESYDRLERARLQMAQSGPIAGALNKCLDMVPKVDLSVQREVVPQLDAALRSGVGFATRAATADAVSSLCTGSPSAFSFPGHGTTNPTVRLLRALYYASEREHGQGARDKMAHALGNLAAISPGQSVRSLALRACERYSGATGNNDDPVARRAAASALRAMAVRASNQLSDGGPRDIWCRRVLPLAFLGQRDTDTKVASLWKEVWEEGGMATHTTDTVNVSSSNFGVLMEEKLLPALVTACVEALNDVSWARRVSACTALIELCDQNVLAPVPRSTRSMAQTYSPADLLRSKRRAESSLTVLAACIKLMVKPRIWTGKADVVKAATKIASQWIVVCSENDWAALGWNETDKACPWMPISESLESFGIDLFVGDAWFEQRHSEMDLDDGDGEYPGASEGDSELDATMEEGKDSNENANVKIDFDEGDNILTSDTETEQKLNLDDNAGCLSFAGLCKALLEQAFPSSSSQITAALADDVLPYRASCLACLSDLLRILSNIPTMTESLLKYQVDLYRMVAPALLPVVGKEMFAEANEKSSATEPPLIIAKSLDCLASAFWKGIGSDVIGNHPEEETVSLSGILRSVGGSKQPAWTVRESSVLCAASLASRCSVSCLRKHRLIDNFLESSKHALRDRKFWKVRVAGLQLLLTLVGRAGDATASGGGSSSVFTMTTGTPPSVVDANQKEKQLALETLLPHKETILQLARSSLTDNESKVTALASDVINAMVWWP